MKTHLRTSFLVIFFTCSLLQINAQDNSWKAYLEQLLEDGAEEDVVENMYQELLMLESNPLNLNDVTPSQLERFSLISVDQAASISQFLEKNRPIYTVYELRNIPLLDFKTVELILPFFYVGEMKIENPTLIDMLSRGRHEISNRLDKTLTQRAGYNKYSDSILQRYPNRKYRGEDFYTSLKYSFAFRDKLQFGILGEKDAGEPFLKGDYSKGYDHYGFHLIVRDISKIKTLVVGDYRLSFGQGLILNNDFMLSKAWASNNIIKHSQEPKRHFSTAESGFFRGVSGVFQIGNVKTTVFYSNKRFDANLSIDGDITSFKTDGYHRTPLEMEKKNNSREQVVGANISWRKESLQMGVSGLYHSYSRMLNPRFANYNIFYLRDHSNYNFSIDYSYRLPKVSIAGETAIAPDGSVATINILQYMPDYLYTFSLLHRHLPVTYNAIHAKAFTESSRVQNENGVYLGASARPFRKISITAYIDLFRFPWLKYQVDAPSSGMDTYLMCEYKLNNYSTFEVRYKYKQKEQNARLEDDSKAVLPYATQKVRLRYLGSLARGWDVKSTADVALYRQTPLDRESGYMFSQSVSYRGSDKIQGDFYAGYFSADSHAARLYSYERNILSTFYMPSFYGKGVRLAISSRYNFSPQLSLSIKVGYTNYFDRDTIGSSTELIAGSTRMDVFSFIRWRF